MDFKVIAAFIIIAICLLAVVVLMAIGTIPTEVGIPILTLAVGAAVGYLFPAPNQQ